MIDSTIYADLLARCEQEGIVTEHTKELIESVIDSIDVDDETDGPIFDTVGDTRSDLTCLKQVQTKNGGHLCPGPKGHLGDCV